MTITATDGNANMATRDVKVTVTNAEEDRNGKAVSDPAAGRSWAITASYSDPDGGLASATWQWWRTDAVQRHPDAAATCAPWRSRGLPATGVENDCRCDFGQLHAGC